MRLYIDNHYFLSVISSGNNRYSYALMKLIHGMGMQNATLIDEEQDDIIAAIVYDSDFECNSSSTSLEEVFEIHKKLLLQLTN